MLQSFYTGDGGYPRSIIAGLVAGKGRGFLSSTDAVLASGKRRLSQLLLRRLLVTESGGLQSSALPLWNPRSGPVGRSGGRDLVQTIELSDGKTRRRRRSMARRLCSLGVPAKSCDGGKRRWVCENGATKSRRTARGGLMSQILTCVLLCLLHARPEQARCS
ncbi:hypothetical protein HID58_016319, partial [Brassica napus]